MTLQEKINSDLIAAMKAKEAEKVSTLRMLQAAVKNEIINLKKESLSDEEAQKIIKSEIKKRNDSVVSYEAGGRQDLADKEKSEIVLLVQYLPPQMSAEEVKARL